MNSADTGITFAHPVPALERATQIILLAITVALVFFAVIQIPLVITGVPILLALLIVTTCVGLIPFTLLPAVSSPTVTVTADALVIKPLFFRAQVVPWAAISKIVPYPLMPSPGTEHTRQLMVGRRKYQPMRGIMLVIPSLPPIYRVHGLLVMEGLHGVIALTNRTHTEYDRLVSLIPGAERFAETAPSDTHTDRIARENPP